MVDRSGLVSSKGGGKRMMVMVSCGRNMRLRYKEGDIVGCGQWWWGFYTSHHLEKRLFGNGCIENAEAPRNNPFCGTKKAQNSQNMKL